MRLHNLQTKVNKKSRKRIGRGESSGHGKTSTRGHKGQKSRSGYNIPNRFEGGQTPLILRMPKRKGFLPKDDGRFVINLERIDQIFVEGETVSPKTLKEKGLISNKVPVKILAKGKLTKKLFFKNCLFSGATKKILTAK